MDLDLSGKVALVTAASRGLGKAAALALAQEGARISICARGESVHPSGDKIRAATGVDVLTTQADLTDAGDINRMVRGTLDQFGRIDILVINAGGPPPGDFLSLNIEDWQSACNLTLLSAVRLCYAVVPHMLARGEGSIVSIQSFSVKEPVDNLILSNSLRPAVIGLMKSLANELGPKGIRVNSINPTWTWTERVEQLLTDRANGSGRTIDEEAEQISASIPLGRMGTVAEFGRTVAWLASPAASFIHGHALMFDGGAIRATL
jgi:3-oxoacyl-[acyl-carrier protein] reductase